MEHQYLHLFSQFEGMPASNNRNKSNSLQRQLTSATLIYVCVCVCVSSWCSMTHSFGSKNNSKTSAEALGCYVPNTSNTTAVLCYDCCSLTALQLNFPPVSLKIANKLGKSWRYMLQLKLFKSLCNVTPSTIVNADVGQLGFAHSNYM